MKDLLAKYKGLTFADAIAKLEKKFPNRLQDKMQQDSFEEAVKILQSHQEAVKPKVSSLKEYAMGGELPEYALGGAFAPNDPFGQLNKTTPGAFDTGIDISQFNLGNTTPGMERDWRDTAPQLPLPNPQQLPQNAGAPQGLQSQANPLYLKGSNRRMLGDVANKAGTNIKDFYRNNDAAPAITGAAIQGLGNLGQLFGGYDKTAPQGNKFETDIIDLLSQSTNNQAIVNKTLGQLNAAKAGIDNTRSSSVQQSLNQNLASNAGRQLSELELQQQQMELARNAQLAGTLNNLGQQDVQQRVYAEDVNARSKGNYQTSVQNMFETVRNVGQEMTDKRGDETNLKLAMSLLGTKDFSAAGLDEIKQSLKDGTLSRDSFIKLKVREGATPAEAGISFDKWMLSQK